MSRPYLNINSLTYAASVLTMNFTYHKLRSPITNNRTLVITGFSSSMVFTESHASSEYTRKNSETLTFTVPTLGTSSTTTYIDPILKLNFGGTAGNTTTNMLFTLNGLSLGSVTASTTVLSTYLANIASTLVFSATNSGYSVVAGTDSLVFSGSKNTGNYYNGVTLSVVSTANSSGSTFTFSYPGTYTGLGTFSSGVNVYPVFVNYNLLGANDGYTFIV